MQKGQVSFDFILAIIVALIFIGGMQLLNVQVQEMQKESAVRNQEKAIALDLYRVISGARALIEENSNMEVKYQTKKILVPGEDTLQQCTISFNQTTYELGQGAGKEIRKEVTIKVEYSLDGNNILFEFPPFDNNGLDLPVQIKCGEILSISKS